MNTSVRKTVGRQNSVRRVSMADIGAIVGVSKVTVAKALHGTGGKNTGVSKLTAEKIRKVAKTLGYRPNLIARQFQGFKSNVLGVITIGTSAYVSRLILKLEAESNTRGYRVMVGQAHTGLEQMKEYAAEFADRGIDGAFCAAWDYIALQRSKYFRQVLSHMDKLVFLGRPQVPQDVNHYVGTDTGDGVKQLIHYLHGKGRKRIVMQTPPLQGFRGTLRHDAFLSEMETLGLSDGSQSVYTFHVDSMNLVTQDHIDRFIHEFLLPNRYDAVLAANDRLAMMIINRLRYFGLRVPEDIAVCGYDNVDLSDLYQPALTTVDHNSDEVAQKAVEMMIARVEGREFPQEQRHVLVKPRLIIRDSA
ncbi:MAG: LacI family DNA-binding transcriptional regulator [Phycisphaerae bacterium]|nr:LacI family DNA-binding transcriptional regulator [Phycisphaerae bacterium]